MTEEEKAYMLYRLRKAEECLIAAKLMSENGLQTHAANRLYYACFYSLVALLLQTGEKSSKTHAGVKSKFNQNFVKTGAVSAEFGAFYSQIFQQRQDADYGYMVEYDEETIKSLISEVSLFMNDIKKLIEA